MRKALQEDPTLWELLQTPLMLYVVTVVYASAPVEALHTQDTTAVRRQHLFSAYVNRMFQRRSAVTRYTRPQTERWLAWLAWQLTRHSQTVFSLERMHPDWLPQGQHWVPTHGARVVAGLVGALVFALGVGLIFGLGVWLGGALGGGALRVGLLVGLGVGLATGLRYGGRACLQHLLLRLVLRHDGAAPWQYVDFLDYVAERIFLRKVGGHTASKFPLPLWGMQPVRWRAGSLSDSTHPLEYNKRPIFSLSRWH